MNFRKSIRNIFGLEDPFKIKDTIEKKSNYGNILDYEPSYCSGQSVNATDYGNFAYLGYIKNPIVFRSINIIASSISAIKLHLFRKLGEGSKTTVIDHNLYSLLRQPNPMNSWTDFIEKVISLLLINGNVFILKVKDRQRLPKELYIIPDEKIEISLDRLGRLAGYKFNDARSSTLYRIDKITGESDVLHLKNFHPTDNIRGLSWLSAAAAHIEQHNDAVLCNGSMLKNSVRPTGAFVLRNDGHNASKATPNQINEMEKRIKDFYASPPNSGKALLLQEGVDWKDIGKASRELDFCNTMKILGQNIASVLGVPIQMLNEDHNNSHNNFPESRRMFYEQTVLPLLNKIVNNLFNNWLCKDFSESFEVGYKEEEIPALSYRMEQAFELAHKANFLTINEKRRLCGMDPIEGCDKLDYEKKL